MAETQERVRAGVSVTSEQRCPASRRPWTPDERLKAGDSGVEQLGRGGMLAGDGRSSRVEQGGAAGWAAREAAGQLRCGPRWCRQTGGGAVALDDEQTLGRCRCSWWRWGWQLEDAAGAAIARQSTEPWIF